VNAVDPAGETPLHALCSPSAEVRTWTIRLGHNATQRLLGPLLTAGGDPTMPRRDGLRPYDLLCTYARFGQAAVRLERRGVLTATNPPIEVAGVVVLPRERASHSSESAAPSALVHGSHVQRAARAAEEACRWEASDVLVLEERARKLDDTRVSYVSSVLLLLLWRQRAGNGQAAAAAQAWAELPEEVVHSILLYACPDAGLTALWRGSFDEIAGHARVANAYLRRSAALSLWRRSQRGHDEAADDARLEALSDEYDDALKQARMLRRRGGKGAATCEHSRRRAVDAVDAFAEAVRRVLYAEDV
jgi:hypothetical protein